MTQIIPASWNRFHGIGVESVPQIRSLSKRHFSGIRMKPNRRKRRTHRRSKVSQPLKPLLSSKMTNSVTSYQSSKTTKRSTIANSTDNHSNRYEPMKQSNQFKRSNSLWKYISLILYGVLGILLFSVLIFPSIYIYIIAPNYSQTGLSESSIQTNHCAGVSPSSLWTTDTSTSITMFIDTSECNFHETPVYFTSMAGSADHFCLTGYNGIYIPTKESFQIYVTARCGGWNGSDFLNAARANAWDVNWMGFYT